MSVLHSAGRGRGEQCKRLDEAIYERLVSDQEASCDGSSFQYGSYEDLQRSMGDIQNRSTQDLDDLLARAQPKTPEEEEAMEEYVETQKKSKFLFDGKNMIKIRPKRAMAIKALLGKAYLNLRTKDTGCQMHNNNTAGAECSLRKNTSGNAECSRRRSEDTVLEEACGLEELDADFNGTLGDFESPNGVIPLLVEIVCDRLLSDEAPSRGLFLKKADVDMDAVNQIKADFKRGFIPGNIDCVDQHVLAAVLISFLKDLHAPLIPVMLRDVFANAVRIKCPEEKARALRECLTMLPDVNRLTLAKICETIHWVVSSKNPLIVYAKLFAPMFLGFVACKQMDRNREFALMVDTTMALLTADPAIFEDDEEF